MHLSHPLTRYALFEQVTEDILDLARAANHAHVPGMSFQGGSQRILVEMMTACHNDDPACLVGLQLANGLRDIAKGQLHLLAKCLRVGQVAPVIYNDDTKIERGCQPCKRLGYVTRTGDNQSQLWIKHLDEQLQRSATTTYSLVRVQMRVDEARMALAQRLQGILCHLGIYLCAGETPAADAIGTNQHLGPDPARSSTDGLDYRGYRNSLTALQTCLNLVVNTCGTHDSSPVFLALYSLIE